MALEEIERLKEKIEKDPNSKLFVPLAEEYKKAGMYDEAIDVLSKGLERQPGYLSARVSLGKIYIERGMLDEAKTEFEKVIASIPDNLYAHKKLAEIYRDLGEKDKAIKEFKTVLRLNPMDEWAATSLSIIEEEPAVQHLEPAEERGEEVQEIPPLEEEPSKIEKEKTFGMPMTEKDFELPADISESVEEEKLPEIPISEEDIELRRAPSEISEPGEEIKGEEEKIPESSISKEDLALWKSHAEEMEKEEKIAAEPVREAVEVSGEESISFEDIFKKPEAVVEEREMVFEEEISKQPAPGIVDADQFINQGKFMEAMNIYKQLISKDPGNNQVMQRIEELKALLKLLGKDKEELIARLELFLEGIRKKRNEFFGST
jgi:tetratricopeptide (TPR) repeat protein